jgi:hypothetical protein
MASLRKKNLSPIIVTHVLVQLTIGAKPLASQEFVNIIMPHCFNRLDFHATQNLSSSYIVTAWDNIAIPKNSHIAIQGTAPVMLRFQIMLSGKLEVFAENNFGRFRIHHDPNRQTLVAD